MIRYAFTAGLFYYYVVSPLPACAENNTLQDRIPAHVIEKNRSFLTLTVENDLFGAGTDEHYTNGVRLTYFTTKVDPPAMIDKLGRSVPFFSVNETTSTYYSLGQNLYTPENIELQTPGPYDRPYAAFLYGSIGYSTLIDDRIDDIELTLGIVGPAALGKPTQKIVHEWISSPDPQGWDRQLRNEPAAMVAYQRTWPEAYAKDMDPFYLRVAPYAGVTLGNVYTYANSGVIFQLVPSRHKWQAPPARVRPAIPGSGYFAIPADQLSWSLFAGVEGRAIARNIFLDGNTFKDSPSVDKKYGVLDINAGCTLTYGRTQLAYTLNWRSDEFDRQQDNSLFGSVSIGYQF